MIWTDVILGLLFGALLVGGSVERTLNVHRGNATSAIVFNCISSFTHFYSIYWITKDNISAYAWSVVGSSIVLGYMARKNRKAIKLKDEKAKDGKG